MNVSGSYFPVFQNALRYSSRRLYIHCFEDVVCTFGELPNCSIFHNTVWHFHVDQVWSWRYRGVANEAENRELDAGRAWIWSHARQVRGEQLHWHAETAGDSNGPA